MRVQTYDDLFPFSYIPTEVLDLNEGLVYSMSRKTNTTNLVSVVVRRPNLDSRRQVEDDTIFASSRLAPCRFNCLADLDGELRFRLGERLRAVLVLEFCTVFCRALFRQLTNKLRMFDGQGNRLFF